MRPLYAAIAHVKNTFYADVFLAYNRLLLSARVIGFEERGVKKSANDKIQKEQEQTEAQPDGA
jgi:hypothetical protein